MADPVVTYIVGDHSSPSTPTPDLRGVVYKTSETNDGEIVYKSEDGSIVLWFDSGDDVWKVTPAVNNDGGFMSETSGSGGLVSDYTEISGGQSGQVGVTAGEYIRNFIREDEATLVTIALAGIPRTKQLVRRWNKIKDKRTQDCQDFLYTWTSAKNWQEQFYVDDPQAVGEGLHLQVWPGRWRQVSVSRTQDDPEGITEVLRLGFQQHSGDANDPLDQAEARLQKGSATPTTNDISYMQEWRYTDPEDHEQILEDLSNIASVTDPTVEGETVTGLFGCGQVKSQPNEDGSILFSRQLTEMHLITDTPGGAVTDLDALAPVVTQSEELLNLFGFEPGDEDKLIVSFNHIAPDSRTACMVTATPSNLEDLAIVGGSGQTTWQMYDRKFVVDEDTGTAMFVIIFMNETWDARYNPDRKTIRGGTLSGWLRNIVLQATGESLSDALLDFNQLVLDEQGAAFSGSAFYNKGDIFTDGGKQYICIEPFTGAYTERTNVLEAKYFLNGRQIQDRGRGEFVVTGDMVSAYEGTAAEDAVITRSGDSFTEADRRVGVRVWFRRTYNAMIALTIGGGLANQDYFIGTDKFSSHNWAVEDHQNGTYTVRQYGFGLNDTEDDGFVTRIKPGITVADQQLILRIWPNVTKAVKDSLTKYDGRARTDFTFTDPVYQTGQLMTHADCWIEDRGESGYTVRQLLVYLETSTGEDDALITRLKPRVDGVSQQVVVRSWATRSEAAKATLTAGGGSARSNWTDGGVTYYHADVYVDDRGRAGYTVRQVLFELWNDSSNSFISRQKDTIGSKVGLAQRSWLHRTQAAKDSIVNGIGKGDFFVGGTKYTHSDVSATPTGNGGWNVTQVGLDLGLTFGFIGSTWTKNFPVSKTFTRTTDDKVKIVNYTRYLYMRRTESDAWEEIDDLAAEIPATAKIVAGSPSVVKKGSYQFLASALVQLTIVNWT